MVSNDNDLMKALYGEDLATIKTLLENGADVNKPYNSNGYTPFMFACREFYEPEVIELFLSHGGDVHSRNISGYTPFMIAAKKRSNPATLNLLLQAGSDINSQDNSGNTAFINIIKHPQALMRLGLLEFFIKNGADKLKEKLNNLFDLRLDGELDRESFDTKRNKIQVKMNRLKNKVSLPQTTIKPL